MLSKLQEPDLLNPDILHRIELHYHYNDTKTDYYEHPEWNEILRGCCEGASQADLLFPITGFRCIETLNRIAGGRLAMLSADREHRCETALADDPGTRSLFRHGAISLPVDYRTIGTYFLRRGGVALHPERRNARLNVSAFVIARGAAECIETQFAYRRAIQNFGPDDFFTLKEGIEELYGLLTLNQIIAFIRLSAWDYLRFLHALPALHHHVIDASPVERDELYELTCRVWDSYFPIGESDDLAFLIGELLVRMEFYGEALEFFRHSEGLYGRQLNTILNMALCYLGQGQFAQASQSVEQALELDPDSDMARTLKAEVQKLCGQCDCEPS